MRVALVELPYHLGREGRGVARGPGRLLEAGAADALAAAGHDVEVVRVRREGEEPPLANEVEASFDVIRLGARAVAEAVAGGRLPLVLAGNCMSSVGTVAGLGGDAPGVVWLDSHADFNTPDTTGSGFLDGMGLSLLTGTGWRSLRERVPGYRALPESHVVLAGVRDVDPLEEERLDASEIAVLPPEEARDRLGAALDVLAGRARDVYVHVDLDVLDPEEGRANAVAAPGGLTADEVAGALAAVAERFRVRAAALTAYDPGCDPEGAVAEIGLRLLTALAAAAGREAEAAAR